MKQGKILRCMVVFLSGLLATTTLVYADHLAVAGIKYPIPDGTVRCSFLRVASRPDLEPVIPTQFECTVVRTGTSAWFRLFASLKEIELIKAKHLDIDTDGIEGSKFFVTGKVLSHIAFVSWKGVRFLTEVARFTMTLTDVDEAVPPEVAKDAFDLAFVYSQKGIGALLREAVPDLVVNCDDTCTLQLAKEKEVEPSEGEIEAHTASGD